MSRRLEDWFHAGTELLHLRTLEEVLAAVAEAVYQAGYDRVRLCLLTYDGLFMDCWTRSNSENVGAVPRRSTAADPYLQILLAQPQMHIFERQAECHSPFDEDIAGKAPLEWACIPLLYEGAVIGKLSVDNQPSGRPLDREQLPALTLFATLAAAAIETTRQRQMLGNFLAAAAFYNAQLFQKISVSLDIQQVLLEFSRELLLKFSRQEVLRAAVNLAREKLQTEYASAVLAEKGGDLLTYETAGWEAGVKQKYRPGLGKRSHSGYTMLEQEPVAVFDYTQETRFEVPAIVVEHAIRSGVGVPIKQADGLDGVIMVQTTKLRDFNRAEIYFLGLMYRIRAFAA